VAGMKRRTVLAGAACILAAPSVVRAQSWPSGTITIMVPYPPGGSNDVIARMVAPGLQQRLGVPVIVENRGGGGTTIGAAMVAKAPRDGSKWLINADPQALNPSLMTNMPYDTNDLEPLLLIGTAPNVLATHPSKPFKSFNDVLTLSRERPEGVSFGVISDTLAHVCMILLGKLAKAKLTTVPYRGGAPLVNDALGGHIDMISGSVGLLAPQIEPGALRAVAQTGLQRHRKIPNVPTVAESGFGGFEAVSFWGMFAPSGTPAAINDRFRTELTAVLRQDEIATKLTDTVMLDTKLAGPETFKPFFAEQVRLWGNVIRENGLKSSG
jgi:tripartite-type tricarboxylate transporter receptor subunit TctC